MAKPWFLYLLECIDGSIYTGIAVDIHKRYAVHAAGRGARYTRSHPPVRILAALQLPDRSSALKMEYAVKRWSAAKKRAWADVTGLPRSDQNIT
jgi:putative endonuclease